MGQWPRRRVFEGRQAQARVKAEVVREGGFGTERMVLVVADLGEDEAVGETTSGADFRWASGGEARRCRMAPVGDREAEGGGSRVRTMLLLGWRRHALYPIAV